MKNNKKPILFIGVAVIAVALVALYSTSTPPFSGSDATGAIGAVEKHRSPQISSEDVILSDETTHEATQALFADYLKDAATLDNLAVELQAVLRSGENLDAANAESLRASLQAIDAQMQSHDAALSARAIVNARQSLVAMRRMLEARKMAGAEVTFFEARLDTVEQQLGARGSIPSLQAELASLESDFEANALGARRLQNVDASLEAMRQFGNDEASLEAKLRSSVAELGDLEKVLEAQAAFDARHQWARSVYLQALSAEQRALQSARNSLAAAMAARSQAAARPQFAELSKAAELMSAEAEALESRALRNLDAQLDARAGYSARLRNLDASLAAISRQFAARPQLSARIPEFGASLAVARRAVGNADQALAMRQLQQMNAELNVVSSYLDQRAQLSARRLASAEDAALGARSNALRARAAETFGAYLAAVHEDLEARSDVKFANNRAKLASRATQLRNHDAMVGARQQQ